MAKKKLKKADGAAGGGLFSAWNQVYAIGVLLVVVLLVNGGARKKIARQEEAIARLGQQLSALEARPLSVVLSQERNKVKDLYYQGVEHYVANRIPQAIATWEELLKTDPDHADAKKNIERAKAKIRAVEQVRERSELQNRVLEFKKK